MVARLLWARPAKRVLRTKQRAGLGAAVKIDSGECRGRRFWEPQEGEQSKAQRSLKKYNKMIYRGVAQLVARLLWEQDAVGSSPVTSTMLNEVRFSNIFVEKRTSSFSESLGITEFFDFPFKLFEIRFFLILKKKYLTRNVIWTPLSHVFS